METKTIVISTEKDYSKMSLAEIGIAIKRDWMTQKGGIHLYAKDWLNALCTLNSLSDNYGAESGRTVVSYFLSNAGTWKGEVAKAIKLELKKRLK